MEITDKDFTGKIVAGLREGRWSSYYNEEARKLDTDPNIYHYGLKKEAHYQNGVLHGLYAEYFKKGFKSYCNFKEGQLEGKAGFYYPGNKVKYQGQYANGVKDGTWEAFDRSGSLIFIDLYQEGKMVSQVMPKAIKNWTSPHLEFETM